MEQVLKAHLEGRLITINPFRLGRLVEKFNELQKFWQKLVPGVKKKQREGDVKLAPKIFGPGDLFHARHLM